MQGAAISFATPISLSAKPRKLAAARFNPLPPRHSERRRFTSVSSLSSPPASSSGRRLSPIVCSLKRSRWISSHGPGNSEAESYGVVVRAAEENTTAAGSPKSMVSTDTLVLGTLFGLWFLFNIYFNIYNKQVLKAFHYPLTVTLGQFAVGTVLVTLMWTLNLYKRPKISGSQGLNIKQIYTMSLLAALSFHAYQQVSYMILQRVSPVTHSVANCVKRVVLE